MDLPEITEVKRLDLRPGDRLVLRLGRTPTDTEAFEIVSRVREVVGPDVGALLLGPDEDIEVISWQPDEFAKWLRAYVRTYGGWARVLGGGFLWPRCWARCCGRGTPPPSR